MKNSQEPSHSLPTFRFEGKAAVQHLNIRKEGPDDGKELAVDIKLSGKCDGRAMCAYFDPGLFDFLFDEAGIVRNEQIEPVGFATQLGDCTLQIEMTQFDGVRLSKFKIAPFDSGVVVLTFSAAVTPSKADVAALAGCVAEEVLVSARMQPGLFE